MTNDKSLLVNLRTCNKTLVLADNTTLTVKQVGAMPVKVRCKNGLWHAVEMQHVLYVPELAGTIFSIGKFRLHKHDIIFSDRAYLRLNARNPTFKPTDLSLFEDEEDELCYLHFRRASALEMEHVMLAPAEENQPKEHECKQDTESDSTAPDLDETMSNADVEADAGPPEPIESDSEGEEFDGGTAASNVEDRQMPAPVPEEPPPAKNAAYSKKDRRRFNNICMQLHIKMNHTSIAQLRELAWGGQPALQELLDVPTSFEPEPCHTCLLTKSKRKPLPKRTPARAPYPDYRWFMDLTGKMQIKSRNGYQYAGVVIDDFSGDIQPLLLKVKSSLPEKYNEVCLRAGIYPKFLRNDCAGENVGATFKAEIARQGTHQERSAPHWQNQNGRAEHAIYRVSIRSNAMARYSNTPAADWDEMWPYACLCESVTKPFLPGRQQSCYEARHGRPFDVERIEPFGCYVVQHLKPEQRKAGKQADKAVQGIFYGYAYHKGLSAVQVFVPEERRIHFVPYEQLEFH